MLFCLLLLKRSTLCSQCASWLSTMFYMYLSFVCFHVKPVVCHRGTNAYTYQLKSLLSIDLGLYLRLNKDLLSKCHYSFCSDGIYIIKMSKQWAQDSSIRMMGKVLQLFNPCILLPIKDSVCYSRGPHCALNVHPGSAQCFI